MADPLQEHELPVQWVSGYFLRRSAPRLSGRGMGPNLRAWIIYKHVVLRQSHEAITENLYDLFELSFGTTAIAMLKRRMALMYRPVYEKLKEKLRCGSLVHADETKGQVKGKDGYVDLFHNPFDEEIKQLAQKLVAILKPIIDTIDKYGLKRYHLHKHKQPVEKFFGYLTGQEFSSELARYYQKRMLKYRDKLFTFLDYDGVPWNNNNSEVAVKLFASRRRIMGASFSEKGIQDYLIFLSIYQICRNKNVSFLRFLRSGLLDVDAFIDRGGR